MQAPPDDWWRTFFGPAYLELYDDQLAAEARLQVDQLESLLEIKPSLRILDLPCGQGRHAIELARRGYTVMGVDLSPYMLSVAAQRAQAAAVPVGFRLGDMRDALRGERFDLVLNLYTSLGYFADEADDLRAVKAAASMLIPGGRLVLEVVNGEPMMANFHERGWFTVGEATVVEARSLNRQTRRMLVERTVVRGTEHTFDRHAIRLYGRADLERLLSAAGFRHVTLYGDWDGTPSGPLSRRLLAIAKN